MQSEDQAVRIGTFMISEIIQVGRKIKDNDPRMLHRVLTVTEVGAKRVVASYRGDGTGKTFISLNRIHTDGKSRRSGWSLV